MAGRQGVDSIEKLTSRDLDRLSAELLDQGGAWGELSRASAWTYMQNIKLFFEWARTELASEGTDVRAQATLPKLGKPLVEILERDEIQRIEDVADSERDKLIVRVLADTGLRVGELVKLRLRDLIESNKLHHLRVAGRSQGGGAKGDKGRLWGFSRSSRGGCGGTSTGSGRRTPTPTGSSSPGGGTGGRGPTSR